MFNGINSSKKYNRNEKNEQCYCNDNNVSYKIIENYRSILDRKQQLISSWKIFEQNGKVNFTQGTQYRKGTDALVIQFNHICLINPWYKYINVNKYLPSILKQNQCYKVFEIVLLECDCLTNSHEYELAIIECPCLEQLKTYCTYCRLTLTATGQSSRLLKNVNQQTNTSFSLDFLNNEININDSFHSQSGPCQHQRTVQIQIQSEQVLHTFNEYEINLLTTEKLANVSQTSLMSMTFDEHVDDSSSETKSIDHLYDDDIKQHSLQSQNVIESNEDSLFNDNTFEVLTKYINRGTQTKLVAILLPQSPLSEMKAAKIEERKLISVTRSCQVNTLSYLIKTNESQIEVQQMNRSSSTSFLYTETGLIKVLSSEEKDFSINSSIEMQHQTLTNRKYDEQGINVPTIQFEEDELLDDVEEEKINTTIMQEEILPVEEQPKGFILISSPLKCVNACDTVDLDEPNASLNSSFFDDGTISTQISSNQRDTKYYQSIHTTNLEYVDTQHKKYTKSFNNSNSYIIKNSNNNNQQLTLKRLPSIDRQTSKSFRLKTNYYRFISRKRRRYRNKKLAYGFLQRLFRRKKPSIVQLFSSKQHSSSSNHHNRFEYHLPSTETNTIKHKRSFNRRQESVINLNLNNSDTTPQYKACDHTIIARTSKNSTICQQLQILLNNHETVLEKFIDSQLILTCNNNYKSVCILIDDHKQSEQYRSSFLHYIYKTLSNTLKKILQQKSIQITCMNLVFFNNSLCDIIDMQRLRLIDTGKKIFLLPSCEISLKTSDDINIAINRLSINMSFAHQIFIINFYHEQSSLSSSFFFLQLAPICSIRPTGLLTNLNSTTYSVLNLIRQLNNGQLFNHNIAKRYLLNDCLLNRLLKSYLFSPKQTMSVVTVKQQQKKSNLM